MEHQQVSFSVRKRKYWGVKKKIFLIFLVSIFLCSLLSGISAYFVSVTILKEKISNLHFGNVDSVSNLLEQQLSSVEQFSNFLYCSSEIKELLTDEKLSTYEYLQNKDQVEQLIDTWIMSLPNHPYFLIQIRNRTDTVINYSPLANDTKYLFDNQLLYEKYFSGQQISKRFSLQKDKIDIYQNVSKSKPTDYAVVSTRQLLNSTYHTEIGQLFLMIDPVVFQKLTDAYNDRAQTQIYILDQKGSIISEHNKAQNALIRKFLQQDISDTGQLELEGNLIFYQTLPNYGWCVVGTVPLSSLTKDGSVILTAFLVGIIVSIVLGTILWFFLTLRVYKPMKYLKTAVKEVEQGDFHFTVPVVSNDEFGELSQSFNHMTYKINELFKEAISKETRLKDAQYKALRAQINPHFLYNTLNSIRWMAMIHKADNIQIMIDKLVRLLRNSAKQNGLVTIKEEIESLQDYVFIQQVAYAYKFEVQYQVSPECETILCPCFILQPIIENSIIHGIIPKDGPGLISLTVHQDKNCLEIVVHDNGVGMDTNQLRNILSLSISEKHEKNSIGISNVNDRLILTYGSQYHLNFASEKGKYTAVTIRFPINSSKSDTLLDKEDAEIENRNDR